MLDKDVVPEFVELAQQFCDLVIDHKNINRSDFLTSVRKLLIRLYDKALELPDVDLEDSDPDIDRLQHENWSILFGSLSDFLGDKDYYYEIFDPYQNEEAVTASLSDDIADIYRDLKAGLDAYIMKDEGYFRRALWEWRFHFYAHWGEHVTSILRPLQRILEEEFNEDN